MTDREPAVHERAIRIGGVTTRYLEAGDTGAPPLLLLHDGAWGGASDVTWGASLPRLAQDFHVLAPDFLGFGGSDKVTYFDRSTYSPRIEQVEALLSALLVERPHVVGSSYGGSIALRMLAESSIEPRSAVSIGGTGGPWKTRTLVEDLGRWDGTESDLARVLRYLMDERHPDFEAQLARRLRWATAPGHFRAVASAVLALPEPLRLRVEDPWPGTLRGVDTPVLLVQGTQDELFEPEWTTGIASLLEDVQVVRMDSLHSPNLDHPEQLVGLIRTFIGSVERVPVDVRSLHGGE
ncbi:alpha/beta fold hydrolase [Georgenia sp. Z1491]|uniref:alpha/beta fold hydrolase n=1 Tax=Georgenia sp. Z1491 TaxID=3416707 RepID=UPI003CEA776D